MVDVGVELELIRPGVYHWSTPEFLGARVALEKVDAKVGPFKYDAGVEIKVPASGKGDADMWMVMKTAGGKVRFKSQTTGSEEDGVSVRTPPSLPMLLRLAHRCHARAQSFMKNFGFHEYATLKVKVVDTQGDKFSVKPTLPKFDEGDPAFLQLGLSTEGSDWKRWAPPQKQPAGSLSKKGAETAEAEVGAELVISKVCAADLMVSAINAGCATRDSIDLLLANIDGRDMRPCHGEAAGKSYGGLWTCKGRAPHSEYNLTEEGEKRVEALKKKYNGALEVVVSAAVAKSGDDEPAETQEEAGEEEEIGHDGHFLVCEGTHKCNAPGYSCWILDTVSKEFTEVKDKRLAKVRVAPCTLCLHFHPD